MDHIGPCILYLLWKRRADGELISAQQLLQELVQGAAGIPFRDDLKLANVRKTLVKLRQDGMVDDGDLARSRGYRFRADAPIVSDAATAAIIMKLGQRCIRQEILIEEVYAFGYLPAQQIADRIGDALHAGYMEYEGARIRATAKVEDQRWYLQKLAQELPMHPAQPLRMATSA